jgi:peptide-methionine (R)-S-oxide reductase
MKHSAIWLSSLIVAILLNCGRPTEAAPPKIKGGLPAAQRIQKSEAEWQKILTPEQFSVLRKQGTERPFTGKYHDHHEKGTYLCAACKTPLFAAQTKFESGTGWPSFYQSIRAENVEEVSDTSHGMTRVEVRCGKCGGHLGHVFDDGPKPTGLRYCINSAALDFQKEK